jgi:hypothetical protein
MTQTMLLAPAALLLTFGGFVHARAFGKAAAAVAASNIDPFFGRALKALWLMDSAGMFVLAGVCVTLAIRPHIAAGPVLTLLSLIPLSTAVLLYVFIGNFPPAHMLTIAAVAIAAASLTR